MREKWHFAVMRGHQIVDTESWSAAREWTADFSEPDWTSINYYYVSGLADARMGDRQADETHLEQLRETPDRPEREIRIKQIEGLIKIEQNETEAGIALLKEAVSAETDLPVDFGPPTIVKPSHELLGDVLSDLGRYDEALDAYD